MTAFCEIHSMVIIDDESPCPYCCEEARERCRESVTRALTAQAWAVACTLCSTEWCSGSFAPDDDCETGWAQSCREIAGLPAPADLAREILGDG